jgi:hypothetical protein
VLAAGVARVRPFEFLLAVAIGRGVRFFGKGLLAVWYGEAAVAWLRDNSGTIYLVIGRHGRGGGPRLRPGQAPPAGPIRA